MNMGQNDVPKRRRASKTEHILKLQKKNEGLKYTQAVF